MAITKIIADSITSGAVANTPAFRAFMNANQNLVNSTVTKIDQFGTEDFDTNSDFASNRFTPTVAGKYFVYAQLGFTNSVLADVSEFASYKWYWIRQRTKSR
jgi:hypothetical protein